MAGQLFVWDPDYPKRDEVAATLLHYIERRGELVHITVAPPKKTREQEQKYHAMLADIARDCRFYTRKLGSGHWKRLCIAAFKHATKDDPQLAALWRSFGDVELLPSLHDAGFIALGEQSRDFGVKLASAFIEWLLAFGAAPHEHAHPGQVTCPTHNGQVHWREVEKLNRRGMA